MKKFLKENWFKLGVILIGIWLSVFSIIIFQQLRTLSDIADNTGNASDNSEKIYNSVSEELPGIHADLDSIQSR